mmetsp:Transcript_48593/g.35768  ORF Transcript_48593/g.35768 Transcript_48593/m.35768 type:complete len:112 (+) Transcript_48593:217-552(+)
MKRVEFNAVEYDWVFKGEMAVNFIYHLSCTKNDKLFSNPVIRIIILFLWSKFYFLIRNRVFFPFIAYFLSYIFLATLVQEQIMTIEDYLNGDIDYEFDEPEPYSEETKDAY